MVNKRLFAALLLWLVSWPAIGALQEAPKLTLPDLDGQSHAITDWAGKVRVVNFWASWCAPCQREIPRLVELQSRYQSQGLQFIGIGVDQQKPLANVARTLGINYPVLQLAPENGSVTMKRWGNGRGYIPYFVVLDGLGRVRYSHKGILTERLFDTWVKPLLSTTSNSMQ